jgi:hypothetical protein
MLENSLHNATPTFCDGFKTHSEVILLFGAIFALPQTCPMSNNQ